MSSADRWNAAQYAQNARFVSDLGAAVLALLAPQPGERILDLGCGDGALTEELAARGCRVIGIDASPDMVAAARRRGIEAEVADARAYATSEPFDAVFSNAALHWIKPPEAVIATVWTALRPGGRFVAEMGGEGNIARISSAIAAEFQARGTDAAALDPNYYPSPSAYRKLLEAAGFEVASIKLIPRPTPLPGPMADWLNTFRGPLLKSVPEAERDAMVAAISRRLEPELRNPDGSWWADYVRLRFAATRRIN